MYINEFLSIYLSSKYYACFYAEVEFDLRQGEDGPPGRIGIPGEQGQNVSLNVFCINY